MLLLASRDFLFLLGLISPFLGDEASMLVDSAPLGDPDRFAYSSVVFITFSTELS